MWVGLLGGTLALVAAAGFPLVRLAIDDFGIAWKAGRPLDSSVVMVDLESWPRSRGWLAKLVARLDSLGPRVIALDVLLDVPRPGEDDRMLAEALRKCGRVVLPWAIEAPDAAPRAVPLLPEFQAAARATGFANFWLDRDGVVRSVPGRFERLPSFAAACLSAYRELGPPAESRPDRASPPAGGEHDHFIDWYEVGRGALPVASAVRLLEEPHYARAMETLAFFRDKLVLVGYLGFRYVGDGFLTPLSTTAMDRAPGAVIHANAVSGMMQGRSLGRTPASLTTGLALAAGVGGAFLARSGLGWLSALLGLSLAAGLLGSALLLTLLAGVVWPGSVAAAACVAGFVLAVLLRAEAIQRLPLVRRVVALLSAQPVSDLAILHIDSSTLAGGHVLRYRYQIRVGEGPGATVGRFTEEVMTAHHLQMKRELEDFLLDLGRARPGLPGEVSPGDQLSELGQTLSAVLLSPKLAGILEELPVRQLHLELADRDLGIPWELAALGDRPLSERFQVSRSIVQEDGLVQPAEPPDRERELCALIVADPSPLPAVWQPLNSAREEAQLVADALRSIRIPAGHGLRVELLTGTDATLEAVTRRLALGETDLLHFSGHAAFQAGGRSSAGFVFPDGVLSADGLRSVLGGVRMPPVVFANACGSGISPGWATNRHAAADPGFESGGDSELASRLSFPTVFCESGVRLYVGCLWMIETRAAANLAVTFYRRLLEGHRAGEALALARGAASDYWMTQSAYVMYGDPRLRLVRPPPGRGGDPSRSG